ncbi:MAG: hypothetical protein HY665_02230 [Chloroflexi bacterium]|nr:hypothetical protein [Chloroflexota bacterium]
MRNTYLRLLQLATGVFIAVLLGIHMIRSHLVSILAFFGIDGTKPTDWESMISRAQNGGWAVLYIGLLAFGLYHSLYGLRGIILEVTPSARTTQVATWLISIIGVGFFALGTYAVIALLSGR